MAKLSSRYANALFKLSMENGNVNEYLDQASLLRDALLDAEYRRIVTHPHISQKEKREFFTNTFSGVINEDLFGFLQLVIAKNREVFLLPALNEFIDLINSYNRKTTANVRSGVMLTEDQMQTLKAMLSKKLNKHVDISLKVDPSIISGLYIHVDGFLIDRTVKKQLRDMKTYVKKA